MKSSRLVEKLTDSYDGSSSMMQDITDALNRDVGWEFEDVTEEYDDTPGVVYLVHHKRPWRTFSVNIVDGNAIVSDLRNPSVSTEVGASDSAGIINAIKKFID